MKRYLAVLLFSFSMLFPVFAADITNNYYMLSNIPESELPDIQNRIDEDHARFVPADSNVLTDTRVWKGDDGIIRIYDQIRIVETVNAKLEDVSSVSNEESFIIDQESEAAVVEEIQTIISDNEYSREGFSVGADGHMLFVRKDSDMAYGAALTIGYGFEHFMVNLYGRGDYFSKPLGSESGTVAAREYAVEGGITVSYAAPLARWFAIKAGADIGYFAQFYERPEFEKLLILGFHGLIGRPYLSVDFSIGRLDIEAGAFFQAAFSTQFRSYDGYGFFVRIY